MIRLGRAEDRSRWYAGTNLVSISTDDRSHLDKNADRAYHREGSSVRRSAFMARDRPRTRSPVTVAGWRVAGRPTRSLRDRHRPTWPVWCGRWGVRVPARGVVPIRRTEPS